MVTEIRSTFMIQDITVEDIFKVCSVLTPGDLRDKCNAASATFLPGLMKVLLSSMEPEVIVIFEKSLKITKLTKTLIFIFITECLYRCQFV